MNQADMINMLDKLGKTEGYGHIMSLVLNLITFFVDVYIRLYTKSIQFM